jgi:hypothetical protein
VLFFIHLLVPSAINPTIFVAADGTKWEAAGKSLKPINEHTDASGNRLFGAGYSPVTGYETLTTFRIGKTDTTIPVASVKDKAGNLITTANISASSTVRMYFNIEAGTPREEPIYCTGISGNNLTGCVRGISFQGADLTASSTIAQIHNAGSNIIMTNLGVMYGNEFVGVSGNQTVFDTKTFNTIPRVTSTTAIPLSNDQLVTKYYADTVVSTGFTSANIDATQGLKADGTSPEKVAINLSATSSGLLFNGSFGGKLGISTSSTGSTAIDSLGRLYFDTTVARTWSGAQTFNGSTTFNSGVYVPTPTGDPGQATPVAYVQQQVIYGNATGTAQVNITAGQAVWMSATSSQIMVTNTSVASSTFQFIGIAASTTNAGSTLTYTKPGGTNCNQSGLTPGLQYYLNGTTGQISTTAGTFFARVGIATSATCLQVMAPKYIRTGSFSVFSDLVGPTTTNVGFYPAHVELRAGCGSNGNMPGYGMSVGDETNTSVGFGYNGTNFVGGYDSSNAVHVYCNNSAAIVGTISNRDQYSFTYTENTISAGEMAGTISYTAWSE